MVFAGLPMDGRRPILIPGIDEVGQEAESVQDDRGNLERQDSRHACWHPILASVCCVRALPIPRESALFTGCSGHSGELTIPRSTWRSRWATRSGSRCWRYSA